MTVEDLWMSSVRVYHAKRNEQARLEWLAYHESQIRRHRRNLIALIRYHEDEADRLVDDPTPRARACGDGPLPHTPQTVNEEEAAM